MENHGCLTSKQDASVPQGQICPDNCMCCHTEKIAADQICYLTERQYKDTRPTSPGNGALQAIMEIGICCLYTDLLSSLAFLAFWGFPSVLGSSYCSHDHQNSSWSTLKSILWQHCVCGLGVGLVLLYWLGKVLEVFT